MKKFLKMFILLSVIALCLASCSFIDDNSITGDVKGEQGSGSEIDGQSSSYANIDLTDKSSQTNTEEFEIKQDIDTAYMIIDHFGGVIMEDDGYLDSAEKFASAVMNGDGSVIASFTGGEAQYYDFFKDVEITACYVYPFLLTNETKEKLDRENAYWICENNFMIEFDVKKSDSEYFKTGKNYYYLGVEPESADGYPVKCFVSAEKTAEFATKNFDPDFTEYFISEFCSLYVPLLSEGRNYAKDFLFGESEHLITHLMADSGKFASTPPYSLDDINEFIDDAFDGNEGFEKEVLDKDRWLYSLSEESDDDAKLYGCSYAHGGTTVEHRIVNVESAEENVIYTIQIFADYACFAPAYTVVMDFEVDPDEIPSLQLVRIMDVTGNSPAYISL